MKEAPWRGLEIGKEKGGGANCAQNGSSRVLIYFNVCSLTLLLPFSYSRLRDRISEWLESLLGKIYLGEGSSVFQISLASFIISKDLQM